MTIHPGGQRATAADCATDNMAKRITQTAALFAMLTARDGITAIRVEPRGSARCGCRSTLWWAIRRSDNRGGEHRRTAILRWRWLPQMGQDRGGFYGFEGLKNLAGLRHRDTDRVHPEWQQLAVGDAMRLAPEGWWGLPGGVTLNVADIVPEKYVVFSSTSEDLPINGVWSFHLQPHWEDRVRVLTRARIALRHPGEVFALELARPVIALGTRGLLLGIKHRVERLPTANATQARPAAEIS